MPNPRWEFTGFSFDGASGELTRDGSAVPLEHQPAIVLARLLASAGELVTREALASELWGNVTHVNFDDGLNYCIRQIRVALGDDPKSPRFIATIPRRGYRFIAPVTTAKDAPARVVSRMVAAGIAAVVMVAAVVDAETRPNNHHQVAVTIARAVHDFIF